MLLGTFLVAQILQHGSSNWLHGATCSKLIVGRAEVVVVVVVPLLLLLLLYYYYYYYY